MHYFIVSMKDFLKSPKHMLMCSLMVLATLGNGPQLFAGDLSCLTCHSAPSFKTATITIKGKQKSLHVDYIGMAASVHSAQTCIDCHEDFKGVQLPHKITAKPVNCAKCHLKGKNVTVSPASPVELYADSVHGKAFKKGVQDAPECSSCHGSHEIGSATNLKSSIFRANIPQTCGKCHFDEAFAKRHKIPSVQKFTDSVHAKLVIDKNSFKTAAVCTDCHGVHGIKAHGRSDSTVARPNVPDTCGKCHQKELSQYRQSIHGIASVKGNKSAPVCTDCHGEHQIKKISSPDSPVYPTHIVATCSKCHENDRIQKRYGLPTNRLSSFIGSFHGVANKFGDLTVANCASCHGAHNVLPASHSKSTINKKNLPATCGQCHPGAGKNFAIGSIHVTPSPKHDVIVFWMRTLYLLFIIGVVGSFVGYIGLDLYARITGRLPWKRGDH